MLKNTTAAPGLHFEMENCFFENRFLRILFCISNTVEYSLASLVVRRLLVAIKIFLAQLDINSMFHTFTFSYAVKYLTDPC